MMTNDYLKDLLFRVKRLLNENLVGLYLTGSASMDDFINGKSDFDVIGVVASSLTENEKNQLEQSLKYENFPCPSEGLDIVLLTKENVQKIKQDPEYEFWYSTGAKWPILNWESGENSEMNIFLELCRQHGVLIYGEPPAKLIAPVDAKVLYKSFKDLIAWHKHHLLDEYHDPNGQNSILNACRILKFVETNKLYSKTEGGNLCLQDNPKNSIIKSALAIRGKAKGSKIEKTKIRELLDKVENKLNIALKNKG